MAKLGAPTTRKASPKKASNPSASEVTASKCKNQPDVHTFVKGLPGDIATAAAHIEKK